MPRPRRSLEEEVVIVRSLVWFVLGIAGGFVAAHLVNKDPRGQELLAQVDARISEFADRMSEAYHEQETRLSDILDDAKGVAAAAVDATADAAGTVADAAKKAAPTD
ncbi:ATPase [Microbacterium sp. T32]|uniref:ATPase n=1 Tax=Microbacterium sp. T32 TaxID=1776083 RepID=UPI001E2DACB8|nr:ATPase [Microbacterium sp. T32]